MSLQSSQPADDGRPAEDEGRSFTTGIGSMVAPTANEDDETAPPARPTFTAKPSRPTITAVPEPARAVDDAAEPETTVPTVPAVGPDDGTAEPGAVPGAGPAPYAGRASADGGHTRPRPLPASAGLDEPLLSDAAGLRARWQRVQAGFVDDPQEAVGDAADLIEQTAQAMVGALRQRQRQLRVLWEHGPADDSAPADGKSAARAADTEHLRQMMQRYRALFNQLCRP